MTDTGKETLEQIYAEMPSDPDGFERAVRDFWDTPSSADYWNEGEDVTHNPPPELAEGPGREGSTAVKRPVGSKDT